jgi:predicted metal-dependent hydrolase
VYKAAVLFELSRAESNPAEPNSLKVGDRDIPLVFVANHRARRYVLRLRPDGTARVTVPRRGSLRAARDFAQRNTAWLGQQLQRLAAQPPCDRTWRLGQNILFRGESASIVAGPNPGLVTVADQAIRIHETDINLRPAIELHFRRVATAELPPRVFECAQQHGLVVRRVAVRDQKSRWGSCSPRGVISLNWRLIQTPQFVSDYIVLHELMHLRQMNHSDRFWREVQSVCPRFRDAERWLKAHSAALRS